MQQKRIWSLYILLPQECFRIATGRSQTGNTTSASFLGSARVLIRVMFSTVDSADAYTVSTSTHQEAN